MKIRMNRFSVSVLFLSILVSTVNIYSQCNFNDLKKFWNDYVESIHPLIRELNCEGNHFWVPYHPGLHTSNFCEGNYIYLTNETSGFKDYNYRKELYNKFFYLLATHYFNPVIRESNHDLENFIKKLDDIFFFINISTNFNSKISDFIEISSISSEIMTISLEKIRSVREKFIELGKNNNTVNFQNKVFINWIVILDESTKNLFVQNLYFNFDAFEIFLRYSLYESYLRTLSNYIIDVFKISDSALKDVINSYLSNNFITTEILNQILQKKIEENILDLITLEKLISSSIFISQMSGTFKTLVLAENLGFIETLTLNNFFSIIGASIWAASNFWDLITYHDAFEVSIMAYTFANFLIFKRTASFLPNIQKGLVQTSYLSLIVGDNMMRTYYDWSLYNAIKILPSTLVEDYYDYWHRLLFSQDRRRKLLENYTKCDCLESNSNETVFFWPKFIIDKDVLIFLMKQREPEVSGVPEQITPFLYQKICVIGRRYAAGELSDDDFIIQKLKEIARYYFSKGKLEEWEKLNSAILGECKF